MTGCAGGTDGLQMTGTATRGTEPIRTFDAMPRMPDEARPGLADNTLGTGLDTAGWGTNDRHAGIVRDPIISRTGRRSARPEYEPPMPPAGGTGRSARVSETGRVVALAPGGTSAKANPWSQRTEDYAGRSALRFSTRPGSRCPAGTASGRGSTPVVATRGSSFRATVAERGKMPMRPRAGSGGNGPGRAATLWVADVREAVGAPSSTRAAFDEPSGCPGYLGGDPP